MIVDRPVGGRVIVADKAIRCDNTLPMQDGAGRSDSKLNACSLIVDPGAVGGSGLNDKTFEHGGEVGVIIIKRHHVVRVVVARLAANPTLAGTATISVRRARNVVARDIAAQDGRGGAIAA